MNNGKSNGWILRTVTGFLLTTLFGVMLLMGNNIIANDKESRTRDTKLDDKVQTVEKGVNKKFGTIVNALSDIKVAQMKFDTRQAFVMETLKGMQ